VQFAPEARLAPEKSWAVQGTPETRRNLLSSIHLEPDRLEEHIMALEDKYRRAEHDELRYEAWCCDDAEIVLVGYGIVARILKAVAVQARRQGVRVGMLRPITLYPFPSKILRSLAAGRSFCVVELSTGHGQMLDDVRLAVEGRAEIEFYGRTGGNLPEVGELLDFALSMQHVEDVVVAG
jgi:pyruvate/2-oxoacid:ferredoxin oxidoreductase alpha subunit